jgi:hypothetical protein
VFFALTMVDHKKEREIQLMRMMLVAAQTVIIVNDVQETTVAGPLPISMDNPAQNFEGWGTSLAWFAEYVGMLEGLDEQLGKSTAKWLKHSKRVPSLQNHSRTW